LEENGAGVISAELIKDVFRGLDVSFIDAAFTTAKGKTYFFKVKQQYFFKVWFSGTQTVILNKRETNTGDLRDEKWMEITLKI